MLLIMLKYLKTQYRTYRKCTGSPELEILPYTGHTVVVPTVSVLYRGGSLYTKANQNES